MIPRCFLYTVNKKSLKASDKVYDKVYGNDKCLAFLCKQVHTVLLLSKKKTKIKLRYSFIFANSSDKVFKTQVGSGIVKLLAAISVFSTNSFTSLTVAFRVKYLKYSFFSNSRKRKFLRTVSKERASLYAKLFSRSEWLHDNKFINRIHRDFSHYRLAFWVS